MHHPFTSPMDEDLDKLEEGDKASLRAKAYDIVLNGYEIGGEVLEYQILMFNQECLKHLVSQRKELMKSLVIY